MSITFPKVCRWKNGKYYVDFKLPVNATDFKTVTRSNRSKTKQLPSKAT